MRPPPQGWQDNGPHRGDFAVSCRAALPPAFGRGHLAPGAPASGAFSVPIPISAGPQGSGRRADARHPRRAAARLRPWCPPRPALGRRAGPQSPPERRQSPSRFSGRGMWKSRRARMRRPRLPPLGGATQPVEDAKRAFSITLSLVQPKSWRLAELCADREYLRRVCSQSVSRDTSMAGLFELLPTDLLPVPPCSTST